MKVKHHSERLHPTVLNLPTVKTIPPTCLVFDFSVESFSLGSAECPDFTLSCSTQYFISDRRAHYNCRLQWLRCHYLRRRGEGIPEFGSCFTLIKDTTRKSAHFIFFFSFCQRLNILTGGWTRNQSLVLNVSQMCEEATKLNENPSSKWLPTTIIKTFFKFIVCLFGECLLTFDGLSVRLSLLPERSPSADKSSCRVKYSWIRSLRCRAELVLRGYMQFFRGHWWSAHPRMRLVESFFEHSAKEPSFLLQNQQGQWCFFPFYSTCTIVLYLSVVVVVLYEIVGAGWELAGCRQIILRRENSWLKTKLSQPSCCNHPKNGSAEWEAPETGSLLPTASGISWTFHWKPLPLPQLRLPPAITILILKTLTSDRLNSSSSPLTYFWVCVGGARRLAGCW